MAWPDGVHPHPVFRSFFSSCPYFKVSDQGIRNAWHVFVVAVVAILHSTRCHAKGLLFSSLLGSSVCALSHGRRLTALKAYQMDCWAPRE